MALSYFIIFFSSANLTAQEIKRKKSQIEIFIHVCVLFLVY